MRVRVQATEDFIVHLFEDTNLCAIHAKRVTISEHLCSFSMQTESRGVGSPGGTWTCAACIAGKHAWIWLHAAGMAHVHMGLVASTLVPPQAC